MKTSLPFIDYIYRLLFIILIVMIALTKHVSADTSSSNTENEILQNTNDISVGSNTIKDTEIKKRLDELFHNISPLSEISVDVKAGVVSLSGKTSSVNAHQDAISLAQRTDGVVSIKDNISLDHDVSQRLSSISEKIKENFSYLYANLPIYLIALTTFILFWLLASFISRWHYIYRKVTPNIFLQTLLKQITRGIIIFIGFVITLEILDATALLGTILGAAGIFGLAIGFALRDTVENYIASILLSIRRPFEPNDHIVIENYEGKVFRLTSRETILITFDGNHIRIPNATVYKGIIINYTRNTNRRFTFEVGVDTEVLLESAQRIANETLLATPGVIPDPAPSCLIKKLGDSNVVLKLSGWTDQNQYDFSKVMSEAIRKVKKAFDQANFDMPEPIYRLKIDNASNNATITPMQTNNKTTTTDTKLSVNTDLISNIQKDTYIDEQIDKENAQQKEDNLLDNKSIEK